MDLSVTIVVQDDNPVVQLQPNTPTMGNQFLFSAPNGPIILQGNPNYCLGTTDNQTVSVVPYDPSITWTRQPNGTISYDPSNGTLFMDVREPIQVGTQIILQTKA